MKAYVRKLSGSGTNKVEHDSHINITTVNGTKTTTSTGQNLPSYSFIVQLNRHRQDATCLS